ncbi:stage III sporulation protein AG [Niallia taxi]|uniref:stage III sporulation protein AG n=1 Tax=Niallia taxi TaxID=2499688 RepID=UPI00203E91EB|nr:stage III sporulation protein AG [Niallia taxi]MCM3215422.1 stage III sporulation protein AG [Niallia taxi]MDK8639724.1 stage III sporulation protein AG [Niallia taxi]
MEKDNDKDKDKTKDKDKDNSQGPITFLKKMLSGNNNKKQGKAQYLIIVVLFGAAIMLLSNMFFKDGNADVSAFSQNETASTDQAEEVFGQKSGKSTDITDYEKLYTEQIKEAINAMAGVKDAVVYVNIDGSETKVYEKNKTNSSQTTQEEDPQGGKRTVEENSSEESLVTVPNGDKQVPIVVETKKPTIRGVLVIAKGAENIKVKSMIVEAVTRALDVPSHRVSVQAKQN